MYSESFAANSFMSALAPTLANSAIILAFFFISSLVTGSVTSFFFAFFFGALAFASFASDAFFLLFTFLLLPSLDDELDEDDEDDDEDDDKDELLARLLFFGAGFDFLGAVPAATTAATNAASADADVESGTTCSFFRSAGVRGTRLGGGLASLLDRRRSLGGGGRLPDDISLSRLRPRLRPRDRDRDRRPRSRGDRDLLSRDGLRGFTVVRSKNSLTAWSYFSSERCRCGCRTCATFAYS